MLHRTPAVRHPSIRRRAGVAREMVLAAALVGTMGVVTVWGALGAGCGRESAAPASATSTSTTAPDPAAVKRGEESYMSTCLACHGPGGTGVPNLGKDLVHSEFVADLTDDELVDFIKIGREATDPLNTTGIAMLPKGGNPALTDAQIRDIVAYLRSIHVDQP